MNQALLDLLSALNGASPAIITRCCRLARIKDAKTLANVDALLDGQEIDTGKPSSHPELMTYSAAAKQFSVSHRTISRMVKKGELKAVSVRGAKRILADSVNKFIKARAVAA